MKPEIIGKILNMPVLRPNDPVILSDAEDPDYRLIVQRGLVRFGSKDAFLGCPMFDNTEAYAEAVLLTLTTPDDADAVSLILENPDTVSDLIERLEKVRDMMMGFDTRYDQIVGYEQVWEAARADTLESFVDLEPDPGPCPECDGKGFGDGPDDLCRLCLGTGKAGRKIPESTPGDFPMVVCLDCGGAGVTPGNGDAAYCPRCNGTGLMPIT